MMQNPHSSKLQSSFPLVLTAILWANSAEAIAVEPSLGALAAGLEITAQYILVHCTLQNRAGSEQSGAMCGVQGKLACMHMCNSTQACTNGCREVHLCRPNANGSKNKQE